MPAKKKNPNAVSVKICLTPDEIAKIVRYMRRTTDRKGTDRELLSAFVDRAVEASAIDIEDDGE